MRNLKTSDTIGEIKFTKALLILCLFLLIKWTAAGLTDAYTAFLPNWANIVQNSCITIKILHLWKKLKLHKKSTML